MEKRAPRHGRDHDPVGRLNDHHVDDLLAVVRVLGGHPDALIARAERIDDEGIELAVETPDGPTTARVSFGDVGDVGDVGAGERLSPRRSFLALARRARAELDVRGDAR